MSTQVALPRFTRIGAGAIEDIGGVIDQLGVRRPLLVTDKYLTSTGVVDRVLEILRAAGKDPAVFDDTVPDPTTDSLTPGLRAVSEHRADSVIGFGGGSPIDTAKALAVLSIQGGHMRDYKAPRVYTGPALPIIAIPTTAGSGSEATQFTIISDSASDEKMLCIGLSFLPIATVIDYELTVTMPPRLTADTGIDALTHAIEAYVSKKANPLSDGLALAAIRTIGQQLRTAYADGTDTVARNAMMTAATQAGMAFSNSSVALVHGMSRPIGAHFHVAHGLSNAMLLPAITTFSVPGNEIRYADCARAFGAATVSTADSDAAQSLVDALSELCRDLKVPTPSVFGIDRARWDALTPLMARQALDSGSPANNPVVPTAAQIEALYAEVFD
ncbi:iron-containing alcohol dehydrogenase [Nocardia callitridis]|uniref:Iron-containing alcohol dehydrogenase n=1 Tax=Nocardia callitridis TaxID=648753 RepID=A0ABP9KEC7_9NOCA